jgi:hypothetical protein
MLGPYPESNPGLMVLSAPVFVPLGWGKKAVVGIKSSLGGQTKGRAELCTVLSGWPLGRELDLSSRIRRTPPLIVAELRTE